MSVGYNKNDSGTWPDGDYEATLLKAEDGISKSSGNQMETWTVEVYGPEGRKRTLDDYVVPPGGTYKIQQLAEALGKKHEFDVEDFHAEDNIGANFLVSLITESSPGYADKNKIARYKPLAGAPSPQAMATAATVKKEDDPIPF